MGNGTKKMESTSGTRKMSHGTKPFTRDSTQKMGDSSSSSASISLKEGDQVKSEKGTYVVINMFCRSGESDVYLSDDITNNKKVVLKLYHKGFCPKQDIIEILVKIKHEDIINVLDVGNCENQFFEVMEYAEGGALSDRLKENRYFNEDELKNKVIPEVVNGLKYCHSKGIIHKDIKPENIFYRDKARKDVVIGDFGISTQLEKGFSKKLSKNAGTFIYQSPEHFTGYIRKESDYYSLGMSLLYLLGHDPFFGDNKDNHAHIMYRHLSARREEFIPEKLSDRFKQLLKGLLTKEPQERWGYEQIARWYRGEDVEVYADVFKQDYSHPPYSLGKALAKTQEELASLLFTYEDRKLLKERLAQQSFSKWLIPFDPNKGGDVFKVEEGSRNPDLALIEISCILDRNVPYYLSPDQQANTPQNLAKILDKNREIGREHFTSNKIVTWLKYTPGGSAVLNRWNKFSSSNPNANKDFESFLHCLDTEMPEANVEIEPADLNFGVVESISKKKMIANITNTGSRGLFSCGVQLKNEMEGFLLKMAGDSNIKLLPNQSSKIEIEVDATVMVPQSKYNNSIVITKNIETFRQDNSSTIEIPITVYVDIPDYSKKIARRPLRVD